MCPKPQPVALMMQFCSLSTKVAASQGLDSNVREVMSCDGGSLHTANCATGILVRFLLS
jgi:hypothetical protein